MRVGQVLGLSAGAMAALAALAAPSAAYGAAWTLEREHVLGAALRIAAQGGEAGDAEAAFAAAMAEIARLDAVLSGWRADSELAALNQSESFQASADLFDVIAACERWREASLGAYCPRLGGLESAWRAAARAGAAPHRARLLEMAGSIASAEVGLSVRTRTITRPANVRFAIDGLAKGYIIDAALAAARAAAPALEGMMLDIGGDVRVWGAAPEARGWRVGVSAPGSPFDNVAPLTHLALQDKAIATSGGGARDLEIEGAGVSHLISPFTGWALARPHQASVIAGNAADADALATALAVLPPAEGLKLVSRTPGAEALIAGDAGEVWMSSGWSDHVAANTSSCQAPGAALPGAPWPRDFALTIQYEIPRIEAGDYERPYLVAWISDAERRLVRTLLVLGTGARWRQSNYVWWRRFERFTPEAAQTISRPTRAPGRYDLIWDGRNEAGQAVPQGRYTLTIEAAREHGGHSVQVIDLDLGAAPLQQEITAQAELGGARVRYGAR